MRKRALGTLSQCAWHAALQQTSCYSSGKLRIPSFLQEHPAHDSLVESSVVGITEDHAR
jgi:hypothetical protein